MKKSKIPVIIAIVILFLVKAWPIALALLFFVFLRSEKTTEEQETEEITIESLKKENEELKQRLGEKIVDDVIAKTESREGR